MRRALEIHPQAPPLFRCRGFFRLQAVPRKETAAETSDLTAELAVQRQRGFSELPLTQKPINGARSPVHCIAGWAGADAIRSAPPDKEQTDERIQGAPQRRRQQGHGVPARDREDYGTSETGRRPLAKAVGRARRPAAQRGVGSSLPGPQHLPADPGGIRFSLVADAQAGQRPGRAHPQGRTGHMDLFLGSPGFPRIRASRQREWKTARKEHP